jgi:hypothetical protein
MPLDIDDLLQTPPADLIDALKALRNERGDLESKESLLMQIIDIRSNQGGEVAKEINELGAAIGLGSLRDQIKQVLLSRQAEEPLMFPKDVRMELVSRGNRSVTLENVRVTMQRMAVDEELVRPSDQAVVYGLPGTSAEVLQMFTEGQKG